jgi:alpha 1,3-glucosidase
MRKKWYDYKTLKYTAVPSSGKVTVNTPLNIIPVFLRGGSIIPRRQRIRRAATLMANDPFTLLVALNEDGRAFGSIYLDDGKSFAYKSKQYVDTQLSFDGKSLKGSASTGDPSAIDVHGNRVERVILVGIKTKPTKIMVAGKTLKFKSADVGKGHFKFTIKDPQVWVGRSWEITVD